MSLSNLLQKEIDDTDLLIAEFTLGGQKVNVGSRPLTPADFDYVNRNLAARAKVKQLLPDMMFQNNPTNFYGQVLMIIRKAHMIIDGDLGEKAFTQKDRDLLLQLGVDKISGMFADLFQDQVSVDDDDDDDGEASAGNVSKTIS